MQDQILYEPQEVMEHARTHLKTVEFLKSRVRVDERVVEKPGEGPLRFWDSRIAIASAEDTGNGLVARERIPKGSLLWSADLQQGYSDILTLDEVLAFETAAHRQEWADYTWAISGLFFGPRKDLPVQEAVKLEASHFLNHSCEANVGFASDTSLVAIRDIEAGEMLANDYCMTEFLIGFFPGFECKCGSKKCRGMATVNDWRIPELQQRYKGYFTSGVQALIDSVTADYTPLLQQEPHRDELRVGIEVRQHHILELGKGLFATQRIKKGEMVCVDKDYGRRIPVRDVAAQADPKVRDYYTRFGWQSGRDEFMIPLSMNEELVDASYFMNHSCDPTAVAFGAVYIAFRDIEPGEEITYDYATTETHFDRVPNCLCGTARCRKTITGQDWQLPELQHRYPPHAWATHIMQLMFGRTFNT